MGSHRDEQQIDCCWTTQIHCRWPSSSSCWNQPAKAVCRTKLSYGEFARDLSEMAWAPQLHKSWTGGTYGWVLAVGCAQLCSTLCNPIDCSRQVPLPMEFFQARILQWGASSYSRGSSHPGIKSSSLASPALAGRFFTTSTSWEAI